MDEKIVVSILNLLHTFQESCAQLALCTQRGDAALFHQLYADMASGLAQMLRLTEERETAGQKKLYPACQSILDSLRRINVISRPEARLKKIEFELLPLIQEAYAGFYFFEYLTAHPEELPEYYSKVKKLLYGNFYIDEAERNKKYKYEVSIFVLAYNKLEYTKRCVESLLKYMPPDLNYELILINHGSQDGTKEYFEQIRPDKQLDIAVNGGGSSAVGRIVEGEFSLQVSNDVLFTPHAIENMLACMRSDPRIAWVVPTTPNISNLQTIPAQYSTEEELCAFAEENNICDPFRWEERVRLCNPIDLRRNSVFYGSEGLCLAGNYHTLHPVHATSFSDDRTSLLLRRGGCKLMLAKDAYCFHFGSVTLKDEIRRQNEQEYYLEGRKEFYRAYQVDPWGTGFCFDPVFLNRVVGEHHDAVRILGINCGLGSNSLRLKGQIKEYCRNKDVTLVNLTNEERFCADLAGISDETYKIERPSELTRFLSGRHFDYILWEEAYEQKTNGRKLLQTLWNSLTPGGQLFVKGSDENDKMPGEYFAWKTLGNGWYLGARRERK